MDLGIVDGRKAILNSDHAEIPLGRNGFQGLAVVDLEDAWVDMYKWTLNKQGYATRDPKKPIPLLHTLLMGKQMKGIDIDHISGDKLDNRRSNLRTVNRSRNNINSDKSRGTMYSNYRGITFDKTRGKWKAEFTIDGKTRVGYRNTEQQAVLLRNELKEKYNV